MTSQKQLTANQLNAQLSTGPTTTNGKTIIATNAIKHGIFTKDLILSSDTGLEIANDYQELLNNLIECLSPCNQMESLLVEKIAVDFWRLRRTIRFETGSISHHIASLLNEFYSYGKQDNHAINKDILFNQKTIEWNTQYIEYLSQDIVIFDEPIWKEGTFESDVIDDLYRVAKSINNLAEQDKKLLYRPDCLSLDELRGIILKYGYKDSKMISSKLIEIYIHDNQRLEEEIEKWTQKKLTNDASDKLTYMLGIAPATENTEKVLKYERSLQKSIFQNLLLLKKLQGVF